MRHCSSAVSHHISPRSQLAERRSSFTARVPATAFQRQIINDFEVPYFARCRSLFFTSSISAEKPWITASLEKKERQTFSPKETLCLALCLQLKRREKDSWLQLPVQTAGSLHQNKAGRHYVMDSELRTFQVWVQCISDLLPWMTSKRLNLKYCSPFVTSPELFGPGCEHRQKDRRMNFSYFEPYRSCILLKKTKKTNKHKTCQSVFAVNSIRKMFQYFLQYNAHNCLLMLNVYVLRQFLWYIMIWAIARREN